MTARVFLDINVLVYAAIGSGKEDWKRERALKLIESEDFGTSAQVLQEFLCNGCPQGPRSALRRTGVGVD